MMEPDRRIERNTVADIDFTTLPEPIAFADTVVERPVSWSPPTGDGWDGAAGGDDGGD
jgi:hypothetical protein